MANPSVKRALIKRRIVRIRKRLTGTSDVPRLRVTRTLKHIYAQLVDDTTGHTVAAASSRVLTEYGGNVEAAKLVGKSIGEKAKELSIMRVRFDRGGRLYHGRIKALADAARKTGLQF
ncbi:MAG: 50S ribosomal protein L18 [Candidatus Hydrogenedentes bacterium]|nr:50S ribosomal protein L18 [Candidatus Hydrogenedentota bacterium]